MEYLLLTLPVVAGIFTGYRIIRRDNLPVSLPSRSMYSLARERAKPAESLPAPASQADLKKQPYFTEPSSLHSADQLSK